MGKFVYKCDLCGVLKEVEHSVNECDTHQEVCVLCEEPMFRVISSNIGISFIGNGFHRNDYAS